MTMTWLNRSLKETGDISFDIMEKPRADCLGHTPEVGVVTRGEDREPKTFPVGQDVGETRS